MLPDVAFRTDVRHGLFLVVKEALNNVVKHAAATEVKIRMEMHSSELVVCLEDNGKGFCTGRRVAPHSDQTSPENTDGEGLSNMRQRVGNLGGRFDVLSQPGQGTQVRIAIPINR